jgi:hypothetical protein
MLRTKKKVLIEGTAMTTRFQVNVVLTCTMVGLVTSCQGPTKQADMSWRARGAPPELQTIDERAQQLMAAVADANWPRVHAYVQDINSAWQAYKYPTVVPLTYPRPPEVLLRGPLDGTMFRLRFAAGKQQAREIMKAANEIDAAALKLFEYYLPDAPLDLRRLRMLEGRIVLNATQDQIGPASDTLKEVRNLWARVRPVVGTESSPDAIAKFEDCLLAQQAALNNRDPDALAACARQAVDAMSETLRVPYKKKE